MRNHRIYKDIFTDNDARIYEGIYRYDDDGRLRSIHLESDDGIERGCEYRYNSAGLLSKREDFKRGVLSKYVEYEYEEPITTPRKRDDHGIDWLGEKVLTKEVHHEAGGNVKYFHTFIFEEGRLLQQTQHAPGGGVRYAYICQYENGRRIRTLKANLEVFSSRIYDPHGVLSEIRLSWGGKVVYFWEPHRTTYNFDWYHAV